MRILIGASILFSLAAVALVIAYPNPGGALFAVVGVVFNVRALWSTVKYRKRWGTYPWEG